MKWPIRSIGWLPVAPERAEQLKATPGLLSEKWQNGILHFIALGKRHNDVLFFEEETGVYWVPPTRAQKIQPRDSLQQPPFKEGHGRATPV